MPVLSVEKKRSLNNKDFKNVFEKHYTGVYRLLTCFLSNRATAEDIAQETFLKFYLSPPRELDNVGGWLMRVARNLAYNHLHREKSRAVRESHMELMQITEPELRFEEEEEKDVISQALHSLTERDRICLTLRLSGMSYAEIAQAIEVKETSVGTILARAKERFKVEYLKLKGRDDNVL
ncbi:sigma-70 family RNA polymerase sigma factor [Desulfosporosinus sp. SB140]|uniref:sigma-70 family RNA polymerase sigma factor n=1 Tax=Desulfosporosinus paludis TaxID=3115649 RepID=UPI00388FB2D8